jgi:Uma2 family endonuclease
VATQTADYREAIAYLPEGAALVIQQVSWEDYEHLLETLGDRPGVRVSYDAGRLEIMTPLQEHEAYIRLIERMIQIVAEALDVTIESYGGATWKRRHLAKGAEPDACYYITNAERVIGKQRFDYEVDPPPDVVVEIDITNESLSKFPIYAAFGVPEIWHYDGTTMRFYALDSDTYREIVDSQCIPGLRPSALAEAIEKSKTRGQTAALKTFRQRWQRDG